MKSFMAFLTESEQAEAAIKILQTAIKGTSWENRVFIAGGYVRDKLLGKPSKDVDLVVDGGINAGIECATFIAKKLGIYKEESNPVIFPRFGTAKLSIKVNGSLFDVEFVAPRKEKYDGISRKPLVSQGSLEDDAMRRDFTINAMFQNLTTGEVLDLTGRSRADLEKKIIRTTGDADWIFNEDPLRILRAVRFALKYNFDLPLSVIKAIKKAASKLKNISNERIQDELNKIIVLNNPSKAMRLFRMTDILKYIMPELQALHGLKQGKQHSRDAFRHTLDVLDATPAEKTRRLAALFHDIGKAATRTENNGKIQFIGHANVGEQITRELMRRLKYSNEEIDTVSKIVAQHMDLKFGGDDAINIKDKHIRKFVFRAADVLEPLLDVIHADNISHSELHAMPKQIETLRKRIQGMDVEEILKTKSVLDGNEIAALGAKGRLIGKIKDRILQKTLENPGFTKREAEVLAKNMINSDAA